MLVPSILKTILMDLCNKDEAFHFYQVRQSRHWYRRVWHHLFACTFALFMQCAWICIRLVDYRRSLVCKIDIQFSPYLPKFFRRLLALKMPCEYAYQAELSSLLFYLLVTLLLLFSTSWNLYFHGKDNGWACDQANRTETFLNSFNSIFDLEQMSVWWKDCDGSIVHLKFF